MRSEVLNGGFCTINGCQKVTIEHLKGGDIVADTTLGNNVELGATIELANKECAADMVLANPSFETNVTRKESDQLHTSISLVCATSQGKWEYLLVNEGEIMLIDGQYVLVKRKGT